MIGIPDDEFEDDTLPGWDVPITQYFFKPGDEASYNYDFGDSWDHRIVLEGMYLQKSGVKYPHCIYLGVDGSAGEICGIENGDSVQLKVKDRLKNNILPSCLGLFDVIHELQNGKDIIKIVLASGPEKPYYLKKYGMSEKGCFIRIGSASEPMSVRMIEELFAKRTRHSLAKIKSLRQDLSFEQLKIYYNESGFTLGDKFAVNLELLTESGDYNYVAYLLSDNNGNSIKVAKYRRRSS